MKHEIVWLFTYKDALGKQKHMAVFKTEKREALREFISNREPTDRLIGESRMTVQQYNSWKKSL